MLSALRRRGNVTSAYLFELGRNKLSDLILQFDGGAADYAGDVRDLWLQGRSQSAYSCNPWPSTTSLNELPTDVVDLRHPRGRYFLSSLRIPRISFRMSVSILSNGAMLTSPCGFCALCSLRQLELHPFEAHRSAFAIHR